MSEERFNATIERLISNLPAACKVLEEEGYANLAGQLKRDRDNLIHRQEHPERMVEGVCPTCQRGFTSTTASYPPGAQTDECPSCYMYGQRMV